MNLLRDLFFSALFIIGIIVGYDFLFGSGGVFETFVSVLRWPSRWGGGH